MSSPTSKRTRSELVATLALPPGRWSQLRSTLQRGDVLLRVAIGLMAAVLMWAVTGAWAPPFAFRTGYLPPRDLTARLEFPDLERTEALLQQKRRETPVVYANDPTPLTQLRNALQDQVIQVTRAEGFEQVDRQVWQSFVSGPNSERLLSSEDTFRQFREALKGDSELEAFKRSITRALQEYERNGLLGSLQHRLEDGSQTKIYVRQSDGKISGQPVEVQSVRIAEITPDLYNRLLGELRTQTFPHAETVANLVYNWLMNQQLPSTLTLDEQGTEQVRAESLSKVQPVMFKEGDKLVEGSEPLDQKDIELLRREHYALIGSMTPTQRLTHSLADFGMYIALYVLCGLYIWYHEPRLLFDFRRFVTLLALVVVTVTFCWIAARDAWRAEIIPLVLFGMTISIAYQRELALLLSASVALIITLSLGQGIAELVILVATVSAAVLLLGRIRSRTKLTYVGLAAGVVAFLTTVGVGTLVGQAFGASKVIASIPPTPADVLDHAFAMSLLVGATWFGLCTMLAGLLMTALLPFTERVFDVQTDISLLELGDAAHPLLQELARRAPGTYNHSINVASIAEAAAETIGANGLLVRVGAYFHDIGKMLKPSYFIENQGHSGNRHQSLMPAMSTLVIIAHVKDGADLARQHHLPQSIIDFIEQHHGTTLVEYFYYRATERHRENPDGGEVDETTFRYPGPKPQTLEAGVLMLADAVESASRALVDPAPARIESLVHDICMKRLLDGQFDECGLTLQQLHLVEDSLVKSLTAVYHGRVKYPEQQQTA